MVTFLANGIMVCAFLIVVENIFLLNNKMEILKANIRDYLENLTLPPPKASLAPEDLKEFANLRGQLSESGKAKEERMAKEVAASRDDRPTKEMVMEQTEDSLKGKAIDNEKMLDSFLKEFFS